MTTHLILNEKRGWCISTCLFMFVLRSIDKNIRCRESPKNSIEIVLIQAVKREKEAKRAVKILYGARSCPVFTQSFFPVLLTHHINLSISYGKLHAPAIYSLVCNFNDDYFNLGVLGLSTTETIFYIWFYIMLENRLLYKTIF